MKDSNHIIIIVLFLMAITLTTSRHRYLSNQIDERDIEITHLVSQRDSLSSVIDSLGWTIQKEMDRYDSLRDLQTKNKSIVILHFSTTHNDSTDNDSISSVLFDRADSLMRLRL